MSCAGFLRLDIGRQRAHRHVQRTATEITDQIERRNRTACLAANGVQRAGQCNVVDVVTWRAGNRAVLPPASHAAIDDLLVAGEDGIGPQTEAFHDAWPKALDQHVGLPAQLQCRVHAARRLQVQGNILAAAQQGVKARFQRLFVDVGRTIDAQHIRAHIGQQHAAERPGPDACELDDLHA